MVGTHTEPPASGFGSHDSLASQGVLPEHHHSPPACLWPSLKHRLPIHGQDGASCVASDVLALWGSYMHGFLLFVPELLGGSSQSPSESSMYGMCQSLTLSS